MKILNTKRNKLIALIAAVGTLGVGSGIATVAVASNNGARVDVKVIAHEFARNGAGQTYGSGLDATSFANVPDLIGAYGVDGTIGYVKSSDLYGSDPTSPDDAIAQTKANADGRYINLYAVDGKTVIGSFKIDPGGGTPPKQWPTP